MGKYKWVALAACWSVVLGSCGDDSSGNSGTQETGDADMVGRRPPPPPEGATPVHGTGRAFGVSRVFSGATDRAGTPSQQAWREYGWNLDGKVTTLESLGAVAKGAPSDVCIPYGSADWGVLADGTDGIDNSFGANVLPIIEALELDVDQSTNDAIASGGTTLIVDLTNLGEAPNDVQILGKVYAGTNRDTPPRFDGTDVWPVAPELLSDPSDIATSKVQFSDSYVSDGTWVGRVDGVLPLQLRIRDQQLSVQVREPIVTLALSYTPGGLSRGVIGGIVSVESLVAELRRVVGAVSPVLCDPSLFDTISEELRQSADSLADGTQDPTRSCDAISIGLGFDATMVARPADHGQIAPTAPPLPGLCSPP
jgi:hypothetical protein